MTELFIYSKDDKDFVIAKQSEIDAAATPMPAEDKEILEIGRALIALHQSTWLMIRDDSVYNQYIIVNGNGYRKGAGHTIPEALLAAGLLPAKKE